MFPAHLAFSKFIEKESYPIHKLLNVLLTFFFAKKIPFSKINRSTQHVQIH